MNAKIPISDPSQSEDQGTLAFFSAGFRPFFLFAGIYGFMPLFAWLWAYLGDGTTPGDFAPPYWHGHEMIFGFVVAAASGFLLTAVPNWTRTLPYSGNPLVFLVLVWIIGRLAMWFGGGVSPMLVAVMDLSMLPMLAVYIGRRLVAHGLKRNYIVLGILTLLFVANLAMHLEALNVYPDSAELGLKLGIYSVVFLVTMISGRVIPGFTANALRRQGIDVDTATPEVVTRAVILSVMLSLVFDLFFEVPQVSALLFALAALALLVRMAKWQTQNILHDPIVWILHAGHFWLVIGFALLAASKVIDGVDRDAGLHALSAGAMGTMIIAMMTRAALGHSGREIKASSPIVGAYWMVVLGAIFRVTAVLAAPFLPGDSFSYLVGFGGLLWGTGFLTFALVFLPIVTRPRAD